MELTVLLPCLNEEKTVFACVTEALEGIRRSGVAGEVLVVDNGSTDRSREKATEAGARVVVEQTKGYGSVLRRGIAEANSTYIVMGDADGSYDFLLVKNFLPSLRTGDDLVMGNRFRGGIEKGAMPLLHRVGSPILTKILNLLFGTRIGDAHCGMRAFRLTAARSWDLRTLGMEFASEIVVKAKLHGARITDIPFPLRKDARDHPPHLRSFRDGWRHLRYLLMMSPSWVMAVPAGILTLLGLTILICLTFGSQRIGNVRFDVHMMMFGAMCLTVGVQTALLWICAKFFGWRTGILPKTDFSERMMSTVTLERGLLLGSVLFCAGFAVGLYLLWYWYSLSFGELDTAVTLRYAIWSFLFLVLGIQTISSSFFLSFLTFHLSPYDPRVVSPG